MEIIIEYVLIENLLIDILILLTSEKILRQKARLIFLISLCASVLALIFPLFYLPLIIEVICKLCIGLMISIICFKAKNFKELCINFMVFMVVTFMYGGFAYMIECLLGEISFIIIMLSSVILYYVILYIIKVRYKKHMLETFTYDVTIKNGTQTFNFCGYLDSGNMLKDPATNKNVIIINHSVLSKLVGDEIACKIFNGENVGSLTFGHFINCGGASASGKMFVFIVDEVFAHNIRIKDACLGLALYNFEKVTSSQILLNADFI